MVKIEYDIDLYPKEVLIKAAYTFLDRAYMHLDKRAGKYIVEITLKDDSEEISKEEFDEEMLIQTARYVVAAKTNDIRKMTLARAFASTLIDNETADEECSEDITATEDILKDWFENE